MNIEKALTDMPALIRKGEDDLWEHEQRVASQRLNVRNYEAGHALDIAKAFTSEGKKLHANEAEREGALRRLLAGDDVFRNMQQDITDSEGLISRMKNTVRFYKDVQANARALALSRSALDIEFAPEVVA